MMQGLRSAIQAVVSLGFTSSTSRGLLFGRAFTVVRRSSRGSLVSSSSWRTTATTTGSTCARFGSSSSSSSSCPLTYETGPYHAAEIKDLPESLSNSDFLQALEESLEYWTTHEYNSAWIYVPAHRASLVETLTSNATFAFELHHTNAQHQTIVLKKWLRDDTVDKIPPYCTHQVGCAGFVLNDHNEILLIQEWRGTASRRKPTPQWKLPGGLLDAGESLEQATCREVWEETGIRCEFESVLTFWHRHGLHLNKSDLYFVSLLRPINLDITPCPDEVSAARWMSIDEFFASKQDHPLIRHVLRYNFGIRNNDDNNDDFVAVGNDKPRIEPLAEMAPGAVQWPNRPAYPTYSSVVRRGRGGF